jgi:hypothetical protein
MNDDFLKQYQKQPDQAFADTVYHKINLKKERATNMQKLVYAFAIILAVLGLTVGVSPAARAATLEFIREVGEVRYIVTGDYPGGDGEVTLWQSRKIPLAEAMEIFPGTIALPTFVPEGYSLNSEVELSAPDNFAILTWEKAKPDGMKGILSLEILYLPEEGQSYGKIVGEGAIEEIIINGKPAALVRGGWNYATRTYDLDIPVLGIRWQHDEHTIYEINCWEQELEPETLIAIAESIE